MGAWYKLKRKNKKVIDKFVKWSLKNNWNLFFGSIFIDGIGFATYLLPGFGELLDIAWAPLGAILVQRLYKNTFFSVVQFIEEFAPGMTDWIPTATIAFVYTKIIKR